MPDPIQSPSNSCWYPVPEGATEQENDALMSSTALRTPNAEAPPTPRISTPAANVAGPPPSASPPDSGARLLVLRHSATHTPQPSVLKAVWACKTELAAVAVTAGVAAAAAAPTGGASLAGILLAGYNFERCATKNEAQQVQTAINDAAARECEANGGTPLLSHHGSVACLVSK